MFKILIAEDDSELRQLFSHVLIKNGYSVTGVCNGKEALDALDKGYYNDVGLNVTITPGGGDISETTAVYNGTVDFGVTWFCNLISADAAGMELTEVAQVYQRSGLELVYKLNQD